MFLSPFLVLIPTMRTPISKTGLWGPLAEKSNLASVGLPAQALSLLSLQPHPTVVQPHPNGSPDWWNLNSWRPKKALSDKRVGRWASGGGVGASGRDLCGEESQERNGVIIFFQIEMYFIFQSQYFYHSEILWGWCERGPVCIVMLFGFDKKWHCTRCSLAT